MQHCTFCANLSKDEKKCVSKDAYQYPKKRVDVVEEELKGKKEG